MAGIFDLIGDALAPYAYIGGGGRAIGTIIPDIVVREVHDDEMMVTDHPVETGAAISDHAFMLPPRIEMQVGASDSTGQSEGYCQAVYQEFLSLQASRTPFDVSTGKRAYSNVLIRGLHVETDSTSEYVLNLIVALRGVIIVGTQTTGASSSAPQQVSSSESLGLLTLQGAGAGAPTADQATSYSYNVAPAGLQSSEGFGDFSGIITSTGSPLWGSASP